MPAPRLTTALLCLLLPALLPHPSHAAWPSDPYSGNVPLCTASNSQSVPVTISDGAGGAILCWQDTRSGASDLYAQRISAAGAPLWTANGIVICTAGNAQANAQIISDGAGGAIISWADYRSNTNYDIYAQRVNAAGVVQWTANGVLLCNAATDQTNPVPASDGVSGVIVAWEDLRNGAGTTDIYAQRINSAGVAQWAANGSAICTAALTQGDAAIASDGAGGAIVAWKDNRTGANFDIYAQRVSSAGAALWTANGVALCALVNSQLNPSIVADGAGGAIVVWEDPRVLADEDLYAQRISAAGAVQWAANGVAVAPAALDQLNPKCAPDGVGGAFITWHDVRNGANYDTYAQRISAAGAAVWTASGVAICTATGDQTFPTITSDGASGAIITWHDTRAGGYDVFAQRISGAGATQWPSNGTMVSAAVADQVYPVLASDGAGGAIIAWSDSRSGNYDIYAQRVERYGQLGNPEPSILSVSDVKNDQGGFVKVAWSASYLDSDPTYGITEYRLFRSVPGPFLGLAATATRGTTTDSDEAVREGKLLVVPNGAQATSWEYVGTQTAEAFASYSRIVATTADSIGGSNPRTYFMVEARASTSISSDRWSSAPDSGYSVDNLAPAAPAPLTGQYAAGTTVLHWSRNSEADLAGYRLYRGTSAAFVPSSTNFVAQLADTGAADVAGAPYIYKLTAVDSHGNESPVATLIPSGTLGVGEGTRAALSFAAPSPNPARGMTTLRWSLSRAGYVRLALYDAAGRRVAALADGSMEAGDHTATFALRDDASHDLPAGLYLARLEAEGRVITRRIASVR